MKNRMLKAQGVGCIGTPSFLPGQADGVSAESIALPLPLTGPHCLPLATPHRHPRVKCG